MSLASFPHFSRRGRKRRGKRQRREARGEKGRTRSNREEIRKGAGNEISKENRGIALAVDFSNRILFFHYQQPVSLIPKLDADQE